MGFEEAHGTGLDHIIGRARCKAGQDAVFSVKGRQNDYRRQCGEGSEQIHAHAVFEDQIQDDRIEVSRIFQKADGFFHVGRRKNGVCGRKMVDHFFF